MNTWSEPPLSSLSGATYFAVTCPHSWDIMIRPIGRIHAASSSCLPCRLSRQCLERATSKVIFMRGLLVSSNFRYQSKADLDSTDALKVESGSVRTLSLSSSCSLCYSGLPDESLLSVRSHKSNCSFKIESLSTALALVIVSSIAVRIRYGHLYWSKFLILEIVLSC